MSTVNLEHTTDAKNFLSRYISRSCSETCSELHSPVQNEGRSFNRSVFCNGNNIQQCYSYISRELKALGLLAPDEEDFREDSMNEPCSELITLANCCHSLLSAYRESSAKAQQLETEQLKSHSEQDFLKRSQEKLKEQIKVLDGEIASQQIKERQLLVKNKNMQVLLKTEKDEVTKLQTILTNRAGQHNHDMKRKEAELNRMKEKMNQLLTDKKDRKASIELLNTLSRADGKRGTWKTGKTESRKEEEMYQFLVGNLETQLKEMMTENLELKKVLGQMKTDMCTLLGSSPSGMEDGLFKANPDEEQAECDIDQAEHSCGTVKEQLLLSIRKQWRSLKNRMEKLGSQGHPAENEADHVISITDHDKEIARLKQEIEQSREVICLQQQLLQNQQAALNPTELPGNLRGCYFLEEQEQLKHDREIFEFQKKQFENERRNFTEAAIRLGHDLFEEERAQLLKHHFLSMTPLTEYKMTPFWKQRNMRTVDINNHENTSQSKFSFTPYLRHCSARMKTPFSVSRTNHPVGHEGTPTTGELYRVLQLAPHTRSTLTRRDKSCVRIRSSSSSTTISAGVLYKDTACQTLDDQFHDVRSDLLDCFLEQSF